MSQLKNSAALLLPSVVAMIASLTACTPEYARQQAEELAGQARVLDSVAIERQNQRLLSHQTQVCLLSADGGDEMGADLLRTIQAGFSGYFLTVGVSSESVDYLRAVSSPTCLGASYLFYVQSAAPSACNNTQSCGDASQFVITVISAGDQSLVDRIKFSIKNSLSSIGTSERARKQKAFEQLALVLTGGK